MLRFGSKSKPAGITLTQKVDAKLATHDAKATWVKRLSVNWLAHWMESRVRENYARIDPK